MLIVSVVHYKMQIFRWRIKSLMLLKTGDGSMMRKMHFSNFFSNSICKAGLRRWIMRQMWRHDLHWCVIGIGLSLLKTDFNSHLFTLNSDTEQPGNNWKHETFFSGNYYWYHRPNFSISQLLILTMLKVNKPIFVILPDSALRNWCCCCQNHFHSRSTLLRV